MQKRRLDSGLLVEPAPGVLFLPSAPLTFRARLMIAVLAGGGTVASHRSAALLHGFDGCTDAPLEVTVQRGRYPSIDGVVVHRAKRLDPADITCIDGIPVTSAARTLCDLGAVIGQDAVEQALDSALRKGCSLQWVEQVHRRVDRPGPSGTATLGRILTDPRRSGRLPDGWLERLITRAAAHPDLPEFVVQYEVRDPSTNQLVAKLDGCFPAWKIGIEGHSREFHSTPKREWSDLARDNVLRGDAHRWR